MAIIRPQITQYKIEELLTLSLPKYSVMSMERPSTVSMFNSDANLSQYVTRLSFQKRMWSVTVPYFTNVQRDELDSFWMTVHGNAMIFKWWNRSDYNLQPQHPPEFSAIDQPGKLHIVRFNMDTLKFDRLFKDAWNATILLQEAHPIEVDWWPED